MTDEDTSTGPQEDMEDRTTLPIGSGPIQIGQAAEFDYSGAQACRAFQEEGARVVLINSNPTTIMTDPEMADKVYIEPVTTEATSEIIERERPDGVIAGFGGQTGLSVTVELAEEDVLEKSDVDVMGTPFDTIYATEDRDPFRQRMEKIDQPASKSTTISLEEGEAVENITEEALVERVEDSVDAVGDLPVIPRTTYTLGGSGSGVVHEMGELVSHVRKGLRLSRNSEVFIAESISGWAELEYEVMRDADDSCVIICNMENIDPMGIHTDESTVVTPSQVVPDEGHQEICDAALQVIRKLGVQGGCNIQLAWYGDGTPDGEYRVVEVNPRVSRPSALASKATDCPVARVTAKVAFGKHLHEITNEITGETTAAFEPAIDYVVTKVPWWSKGKFIDVDFEPSMAIKPIGGAMPIGRIFEESLLKALRSSEYDPAADWDEVSDEELEAGCLETPAPDRPYAIFGAFERGYTTEDVVEPTDIRKWYVERFGRVVEAVEAAAEGDFIATASTGHTNASIAAATGTGVGEVGQNVPGCIYKQVGICAGEFAAQMPYHYSACKPEFFRGPFEDDPAGNELRVDRDMESVVVVGGGPIRIGQGVEFDYCSIHAVQMLHDVGIDVHVVNNNPETVSTDYDTSDDLFFEPIAAEEIADVIEAIDADGIMLQFGGQTSVDIGHPLESELNRRGVNCEILGTTIGAMDLAEDRDRFSRLMDDLGTFQPEGGSAASEEEALNLANDLGYPVLVRPSYVLGGRAMEIVHSDADFKKYTEGAVHVSPDKPILTDEPLADGVELDVDAISDSEDVLIGGVMKHVETAGVHSGDSACMIPLRSLDDETVARVREVTEDIANVLDTVGLMNVQLAVKWNEDGSNDVYVLEANPRSSWTVLFVSKATGVLIAKPAVKAMAGNSLADLDASEQIPEQVSVKGVVLPFDRLPGSDPRLGPEMKSTGEVMGTVISFGKAYKKAQSAANDPVPANGTVYVDLADPEFPDADSETGQELLDASNEYYEVLTPDDVDDFLTVLREGDFDFVVPRGRGALIGCVEEEVSYFSMYASAKAALEARGATDEDIGVLPVGERPRVVASWGQ